MNIMNCSKHEEGSNFRLTICLTILTREDVLSRKARAIPDRQGFHSYELLVSSSEIQESSGYFKLRELHALLRWRSKEECTVTVF